MKVYRSKKAEQGILRTYDALLAKWGVSVTETDIETPYGTTHVVCCGDKSAQPLTLFHGVGDDSALMWLFNAKALAARYRVYAVDTLGGPGKSRPNERYAKDFDDVLWIDAVLDGLGVAQTHIMGVSHGGYLSQLYTLRRPERVLRTVVLACTIAEHIEGQKNSSMKTMMKIFLPEALFPTKRNVEKLMRKLSGEHVSVFLDDPLIMEHYAWLLKGFNNMSMTPHRVSGGTKEEIATLRARAYYIVGLEDPFEKLGGREQLLKYDMNARFYRGVGHGINHEIADEINALVPKLLDGEMTTLRDEK